MAASQLIELSLLTSTLNILLGESWSNTLTGTEVIKAAHGIKRGVAIKRKTIKTEAVNFFLSACCEETLEFAIGSGSLKLGHGHFFKTTALVLSRC